MERFIEKRTLIFTGLLVFFAAAAFAGNRLNAEWQSLFDGKTLQGWVQRGGEARYTVEDGCIVGESVPGQPNSFLCTKAEYANFILELEFKVDPGMNSGIQIRSASYPEYMNGRVHGYQVEIDPSERAWTGGIYDEGRRGWLYDLRLNEAARKAFKPGAWNAFHIEAVGDTIRTWVNGVPAAYLLDGVTRQGFIALQVHQCREPGLTVRWRNIRILDLGTCTEFPPVLEGHAQEGQPR